MQQLGVPGGFSTGTFWLNDGKRQTGTGFEMDRLGHPFTAWVELDSTLQIQCKEWSIKSDPNPGAFLSI